MPPWLIIALIGGVAALAIAATESLVDDELEFDWDVFIAAHSELRA